MPAVRVNTKAAGRLASGHLWIFLSDVLDHGSAQPGDVVRVIDPKGRNLGVAHYSSTSQITLRLLSSRVEPIDDGFLRERFAAAYRYRQRFVHNSNAYRLVHAEGDLLPGLIVDRYGDWLVVQLLNQGMDRMRGEIAAALIELLNPRGIVARNDVAIRAKENLPQETSILSGEVPPQVEIEMNGLTLFADLLARPENRCLSRSARELSRRCASMPAVDAPSIALLEPAASPCTSLPPANRSRRSIAPLPPSKRSPQTQRAITSKTSRLIRPTCSNIFPVWSALAARSIS